MFLAPNTMSDIEHMKDIMKASLEYQLFAKQRVKHWEPRRSRSHGSYLVGK